MAPMGAAHNLLLVAAFLLGPRLSGSTSPWRLSQDHLQDAFQRPTVRPHADNRNPGVISNSVVNERSSSSSSGSSSTEEASADKSYKTFYRVFYGTPPPPPPPSQEQPGWRRVDLDHQQRSFARPNAQVLEDIRAANEHFLRVRTNFRCGVPAPRVLRVQDVHPDPSREYLPRCAVLHRCADDVGCCDNDAFHCAPRAVQEVTLTFYVLTVSMDPNSPGLTNGLDKLLFENHTECECRPVHNLPRAAVDRHTEHRLTSGTSAPITSTTAAPTITTTVSTTTTSAAPKEENTWWQSKCRECPVPFQLRQHPDGRCGCDCFDRDKPCLKVKRGKEPLDEVERRCVEVAHCHIPDCDYGEYDYDSGKCPKRPDNYRRPQDGKGHINPAHRWNFLERD